MHDEGEHAGDKHLAATVICSQPLLLEPGEVLRDCTVEGPGDMCQKRQDTRMLSIGCSNARGPKAIHMLEDEGGQLTFSPFLSFGMLSKE